MGDVKRQQEESNIKFEQFKLELEKIDDKSLVNLIPEQSKVVLDYLP